MAEFKNIGMINIPKILSSILKQSCYLDLPTKLLEVKCSDRPKVDYTLTTIKAISAISKKTPIEIIEMLIKNDHLSQIVTSDNIGIYLNFNLNKSWVLNNIYYMLHHNIFNKNDRPENIIIDFSSPNIAKDMHFGHFRSTVIGDVLCNMFDKLGHNVSRINHVGNYGLPIGMIIHYINKYKPELSNLQLIYQQAKLAYDGKHDIEDTDKLLTLEFQKGAHECTVKLQNNDPDTLVVWKIICNLSRVQYEDIYNKLNINITEVGESFYGPLIPDLINELESKGLLIMNEGRKLIKSNKDVPFTVVKSDGGYTYGTTDLAAIKYRLCELKADRIYYVVGQEQKDHFSHIIEIAKKAGWLTNQIVIHVDFGLINDEKGKRFRSRDGDTVKLIDLLNEGLLKAEPEIIYNSMKFFDLQSMRKNSYNFSYDKMLDPKGKTACYLSYTNSRVCGIIEKANKNMEPNELMDGFNINELLDEDFEIMKFMLRFPEILNDMQTELLPSTLCTYLHQLCSVINKNYKICVCVNKNQEVNISRYIMFLIIKKLLKEIFDILGLTSIEKMDSININQS